MPTHFKKCALFFASHHHFTFDLTNIFVKSEFLVKFKPKENQNYSPVANCTQGNCKFAPKNN